MIRVGTRGVPAENDLTTAEGLAKLMQNNDLAQWISDLRAAAAEYTQAKADAESVIETANKTSAHVMQQVTSHEEAVRLHANIVQEQLAALTSRSIQLDADRGAFEIERDATLAMLKEREAAIEKAEDSQAAVAKIQVDAAEAPTKRENDLNDREAAINARDEAVAAREAKAKAFFDA